MWRPWSPQSAAGALSAAGLPLETAFSLLSESVFHIGNNSGLSHVAAAFGVPTLCLSGPSNPAKSGPLEEGPYTIWAGSAETGRESAFRVHPALEAITADRVLALVREKMSFLTSAACGGQTA